MGEKSGAETRLRRVGSPEDSWCERDRRTSKQRQSKFLLVFLAGGRVAKIRRTFAIYRMTFIYAPTKRDCTRVSS